MSLVGPRPERPEFIQQLTEQIPYYGQRHIVKPGLTGWAQVRYAYGSSVEDAMEKLQYDLFYIKHMSLGDGPGDRAEHGQDRAVETGSLMAASRVDGRPRRRVARCRRSRTCGASTSVTHADRRRIHAARRLPRSARRAGRRGSPKLGDTGRLRGRRRAAARLAGSSALHGTCAVSAPTSCTAQRQAAPARSVGRGPCPRAGDAEHEARPELSRTRLLGRVANRLACRLCSDLVGVSRIAPRSGATSSRRSPPQSVGDHQRRRSAAFPAGHAAAFRNRRARSASRGCGRSRIR